MVGSNYSFPYESNRIIADLVTQSRGKILDEIYVSLDADAEDFRKPIRLIEKLKPDVIFSTVVGQATSTFYRAYREAGFDPSVMPIASLTTSEAEVAEMPPDVAEGHITAAPFFETLGTPAATRFVKAFKARFGADAPVTACAEAAYSQVHLAARALGRAGTDDPERLILELREAEFDAPQGRVTDRRGKQPHLSLAARRAPRLGRPLPDRLEPRDAGQARSLQRRPEPRRLVGGFRPFGSSLKRG